jgi:predicted RNA-binding protein YlqC (UPF0109 family)
MEDQNKLLLECIKNILYLIVDEPDKVFVTISEHGENTLLLQISTDNEKDRKHILGERGQTIGSIMNIGRAISRKFWKDRNIVFEFCE